MSMTCKMFYKYVEKLCKEVKFAPTTFFVFFVLRLGARIGNLAISWKNL